jgi:putative addiction module component (TIGR02574 family)
LNFSFAKPASGSKVSGMSVEQLEQSVLKLSPDERRRFLDWLHAHEDELMGAVAPTIDIAWKQETRRRVAEIESGAVTGIPGEEVSARVREIVER